MLLIHISASSCAQCPTFEPFVWCHSFSPGEGVSLPHENDKAGLNNAIPLSLSY